MSSQSTEPRIQALPKKVVDRIAAGEVVQRPASVIKELIENSLDADSTNIDVQCQGGGLRLLSVSDDGFGIHPQDLSLAATRFATSKLKQWDDLKQIQTFGFRGEALASASMVGRLSIVSRKRKLPSSGGTSCAFKMSYSDGEPTSKAVPSAGKEGTCVKLQDLFYNLQSRKRAFEGTRKENEEYQKILNVVQRYSVHKADHGVGFVCRKKGGQTDLNTASIATIKKLRKQIAEMEKMEEITDSLKADLKALKEQSTRDVIGHVYGSEMAKELLPISCSKGDVEKVTLSALEAMKNEESTLNSEKSEMKLVTEGNSLMDGLVVNMHDYGANIAKETESQTMIQSGQGQFSFAYRCRGFITNGSYCVPKASSAFLLFINGRLVESSALKKAVESVYMDMLPKGAKPFVYLSLELPGPHLDVNVHPTKREVAFLHEDQLCEALASSVRELLQDSSTSRTFYTQTLLVGNSTTMKLSSQEEEPRVLTTNTENSVKSASKSDNGDNDNVSKKSNQEEVSKRKAISGELSSKKRKVYDPKNLIRTSAAAEQGALEPFLVLTQPKSSSQDLPGSDSSSTSDVITEQGSGKPKQDIVHAPECIFASGSKKIDMSIPGAFASICRCQVEQASSLPKLTGFTQNVMRPKKIKPTKCSYTSIQNLRKDIQTRANNEFTSKLRDSVFVGCISRSRCLLQSGIELIMVNPYELSKETFYQLALLRFGGFQKASFEGDGLQVQALIEKALEMDEALKPSHSLSQKVEDSEESKDLTQDETNIDLARQATVCLAEKSAMLEEYFSIEFEMDKDNGTLYLKGLPVILDGHFPSPQHLPAFLLHLATEVDYTDEMKCFEGVCTELSRYYAEVQIDEAVTVDQELGESRLELISESEKKYIQHTLYPAFRFLLVVPKDFASDGTFCKLAVLSKLYKVFERC